MIDTYFLYLEERLIDCIYNVSGSMRVDTVCIVSIVSGAEADTLYLQCVCSLSACIYHLSRVRYCMTDPGTPVGVNIGVNTYATGQT